MGLGVVSAVRGTLEGEHQILGVDDRDVLVIVEGAVESIGI